MSIQHSVVCYMHRCRLMAHFHALQIYFYAVALRSIGPEGVQKCVGQKGSEAPRVRRQRRRRRGVSPPHCG